MYKLRKVLYKISFFIMSMKKANYFIAHFDEIEILNDFS